MIPPDFLDDLLPHERRFLERLRGATGEERLVTSGEQGDLVSSKDSPGSKRISRGELREASDLVKSIAEVASGVVVRSADCGTLSGITQGPLMRGDQFLVPLRRSLRGRVACDDIADLVTGAILLRAGELITEGKARAVEEIVGRRGKLRVRSSLTCEDPRGLCAACYGEGSTPDTRVELGAQVGLQAAESLAVGIATVLAGDPVVVVRNFRIGGVASQPRSEPTRVLAGARGQVKFVGMAIALANGRAVELEGRGEIWIVVGESLLETHSVPAGAVVHAEDQAQIEAGAALFDFDHS